MPIFIKKPIPVEAECFDGSHSAISRIKILAGNQSIIVDGLKLIIPTLEGNMVASVSDWIIKGVNGEVYPCKHDIFEKTYNLY